MSRRSPLLERSIFGSESEFVEALRAFQASVPRAQVLSTSLATFAPAPESSVSECDPSRGSCNFEALTPRLHRLPPSRAAPESRLSASCGILLPRPPLLTDR